MKRDETLLEHFISGISQASLVLCGPELATNQNQSLCVSVCRWSFTLVTFVFSFEHFGNKKILMKYLCVEECFVHEAQLLLKHWHIMQPCVSSVSLYCFVLIQSSFTANRGKDSRCNAVMSYGLSVFSSSSLSVCCLCMQPELRSFV